MDDLTARLHAGLDLDETLDLVAQAVVELTGFRLAAVNLVLPDGGFVAAAVAGPPEVSERLLGSIATERSWQELLAQVRPMGDLWFVGHQQTLPDMTEWVPDLPDSPWSVSWHAQDTLLAPLRTPAGDLIGMVSVDQPRDGLLPGRDQRQLLTNIARIAAKAIEGAQSRTPS